MTEIKNPLIVEAERKLMEDAENIKTEFVNAFLSPMITKLIKEMEKSNATPNLA